MAEERVERRLTAILAADVSGYSRLMGRDEEGTLTALKVLRKSLIDPKIEHHRGRIVKTTGDGALVEFASAVDAVRCAIEIQQAMAERNAAIPEERRIEFRIGNAVLNVFKLDGERAGEQHTHVPWVYVDDLEAHFAHAKGNGATIVEEIHSYPGSSVYVADDLEGNRWTFSRARPTMR